MKTNGIDPSLRHEQQAIADEVDRLWPEIRRRMLAEIQSQRTLNIEPYNGSPLPARPDTRVETPLS